MGEAAVAKPLHIGATALRIENNFFLQQIRLNGLDAGISTGAFGARPKDLSAEQWAERTRKHWDAIRYAFENWLNSIGQDINQIRDEIDQTIENIDKRLEQLEDLQPAEAHKGTLKRLKKDREAFVQQRETLDDIDDDLNFATPATAWKTQNRFERFQNFYGAFKKKFENRSTSTRFNTAKKAANDDPRDTRDHDYNEWSMDIGPSDSSSNTGTTDEKFKKLLEELERMHAEKNNGPYGSSGPKSPPPVPS